MKKVLYIDMDNVLVDFPSGIAHLERQYAVMGYRETKIVLFDRTVPGREYLFDSVEELLDAGWVVD